MRTRFGASRGQGLIEYALILGLISLLVIAVFLFIGEDLAGSNGTINTTLTEQPGQNAGTMSAVMY